MLRSDGVRCRRPFVALLVWVVLLVAGVRAAQIIRVAPLARDGQILVSFEFADAYDAAIREAIGSGLTTTFSYDIRLRRAKPLWFDTTVDSTTMSVEVRYDNLTRRFQMSRLVKGRVEESRVTEVEAEVRLWMTRFEYVPLFSTTPLEPNSEYYLRVEARTRPRRNWLFWPWGRVAASAIAKFTFLP